MLIRKTNPETLEAREMMDLLWGDVQRYYSFEAPNPMKPGDFQGDRAAFWIAKSDNVVAGSIAIAPLNESEAELDVMYVRPEYRRSGIAKELLNTLESFAKEKGFARIKLRAGEPQVEAVKFYEGQGFARIPPFGKWTTDPTAWCFEKKI